MREIMTGFGAGALASGGARSETTSPTEGQTPQ
jgi:hypothetical protein